MAGHDLDSPTSALVVDQQTGILTAVYGQYFRDSPQPAKVYARRFTLTGEPLTPDLPVSDDPADSQGIAVVASQAGGGFVTIWASGKDGSRLGVFGRRFSGTGAPIGPEFQVNQVTLSDQLPGQVASNAAGDFVVVWKSFDPSQFGANAWDIKARLYRADGREDPCVYSGGLFRCDTGHNGGRAEWSVRFGLPGDQPLLGDFDGDGRDDPCVYRRGTLFCDTAHDGGVAEGTLTLGNGGDRLVLGNLDGL